MHTREIEEKLYYWGEFRARLRGKNMKWNRESDKIAKRLMEMCAKEVKEQHTIEHEEQPEAL